MFEDSTFYHNKNDEIIFPCLATALWAAASICNPPNFLFKFIILIRSALFTFF